MLKNGFIKKADIILFVVLLVLGIGGTVLLAKNAGDNAMVEISVDGSVYKTVELNKDQTIEIENEFGRNVIVVKDGCVSMVDADCPGEDCKQMGEISKGGQAIMCLPHRLIVTIVKGDELDAAAY